MKRGLVGLLGKVFSVASQGVTICGCSSRGNVSEKPTEAEAKPTEADAKGKAPSPRPSKHHENEIEDRTEGDATKEPEEEDESLIRAREARAAKAEEMFLKGRLRFLKVPSS